MFELPLLLAPLSVALPQEEPAPEAPLTEPHAHTNRLAGETSPYLLQHAHNPVDWYPWGPEALERAKTENKPIFLSIGYSACHWCHVMERESFEDEAIAAVMNEHFVNVKVDREERPDVDEIYMKAVQALTGSGGWPLSVWLTPELEPFFGGTYFPPDDRYGRRGFPAVCEALADAWKNDRERVVEQAGRLREHIAREGGERAVGDLHPEVIGAAADQLARRYDSAWGGFGDAPKFLHTMELRLLLRHWLSSGDATVLEMVTHTLDRMAAGGLYDQLGGAFHRYSTDEQWLIPHFEKMLYDNALMVPLYLEAHLATRNGAAGNGDYARIARECCEWVLREMVTPEGGFASSQDADSEGEEGKFFAWTPDELTAVLGAKRGLWAAEWYGVTDEGNFEHGKSALWRKHPAEQVAARLGVEQAELEGAMREARLALFAARAKRVAPGTDDKVLAAWNGLMIGAMAQAYQVLDEPRYLDAARAAARYVLEGMRQEDGRLFATARHGRAHLNAYLDDYAFMIQGLIDLYESDFDPRWLREALTLNEVVLEHFDDPELGGFYTTGDNHEQLIARLKAPMDGALPSGNGVMALNLLRLAELTGRGPLAKEAERTIRSIGNAVNQYPPQFSQLLMAVDFLAAEPREIVVAGEPTRPEVRAMLAEIRGRFRPQRVVALAHASADSDLIPLLEGRSASPETGARGYVCQNYACQRPVDTAEELAEQLRDDR